MPERTRVAICGVSVRSSWPGGEPAVLKTWVQSLHAFDLRLLHPGGPVGALRTILRYRAKCLYGYDYYVEELRRFAPDLCVGFTDYDLSYVLAARDLGIPLILNVQTHWMACPIQSAFDFKGEYHPQASLPRCL